MGITDQSQFLLEVFQNYGIVGFLTCSLIFLLLNSKIKFEHKKFYHYFKFEFGGIRFKSPYNRAAPQSLSKRKNADHSLPELISTALLEYFFNGQKPLLKHLILIGIVFLLII